MRRALAALAGLVALSFAGAGVAQQPAAPAKTETAIFAGGCFWCMEPPFDALPGVISTTSGYTAGHEPNPTYKSTSTGKTGHTEAVQIVYDPAQVTYARLLEVFWRNHDPLTANAQFCDKGSQYRAGIYYASPEQKRLAEESKAALEASGRFKQPIVTEVEAATQFYPAEEEHQDYHLKNPIRYKFYRSGCGRDSRLRAVWGEEAGGPKS